jgi:hypothetical protein
MKKVLFGLLMVATIASCKKNKDTISCDVSVAGIAGSYKITKASVAISGFPTETDLTSTLFDVCDLGGVYQLKADKTVVYTEAGGACTANGTGTWDIVSGNIVMSVSGGGFDLPSTAATTKVAGWDCTTLTLTEVPTAGQTYKYTFTKQ